MANNREQETLQELEQSIDNLAGIMKDLSSNETYMIEHVGNKLADTLEIYLAIKGGE